MRNGNYLPTTAASVTVNAFNPPMVNTSNEPEIERAAHRLREKESYGKNPTDRILLLYVFQYTYSVEGVAHARCILQ